MQIFNTIVHRSLENMHKDEDNRSDDPWANKHGKECIIPLSVGLTLQKQLTTNLCSPALQSQVTSAKNNSLP
jgi:hypothetical protein